MKNRMGRRFVTTKNSIGIAKKIYQAGSGQEITIRPRPLLQKPGGRPSRAERCSREPVRGWRHIPGITQMKVRVVTGARVGEGCNPLPAHPGPHQALIAIFDGNPTGLF